MSETPGAVLFSSSCWVSCRAGCRRLKLHRSCGIVGVCVSRYRALVGCSIASVTLAGVHLSVASPSARGVVINSASASVECSSEVLGIRSARPAPSSVSWSPAGHARCRLDAGCCPMPDATAVSTCRRPRSTIPAARDRCSRKAWKSRPAARVLLSRAWLLVDCDNVGSPQSWGPQHEPCATTRPVTGRSLIVGGVLWCGCRVVEATRPLGLCVLPRWWVTVRASSGADRLVPVSVVAVSGCGGVGVGWV